MEIQAFQAIYTEITALTKATCTLKAKGITYDELAWVDGRNAQVIKIEGELVTLQVFSGTEGIGTAAKVIFAGKPPSLALSPALGGRYFNAFGQAIDGLSQPQGKEVNIKGLTVNPVRRQLPSEMLSTGIAGIDLNNTLVTGQKIPFFADPDQPFNRILAEVALRADSDRIVLGAMGISHDDYIMFRNSFKERGASDKIVSFINTSEDPPLERLLIPDQATATAEYFAYEKKEKVLVLLSDMTLYADALAIVSNKMDQIPSKDAMPGSLYSDLARIYEKAVQFPEGGSITIIAVTTLNDGDITHAIPDNTGYITEGQLYLKRDTDTGLTIIDPFRSLSRLKQNVIGKKTRADHPQLMNALVRLYADASEARSKQENGFDLNDFDVRSLAFAKDYVRELLDVRLNIDSVSMLDIGWKLLAKHFKVFELGIKQEFIDKYWPGEKD
jgi:V/A-type H+-transporting ATPase subunit B